MVSKQRLTGKQRFPGAMGKAAVELLKNPNRHKAMKDAARQKAVEKFATDAITKKYEDYYVSVITGKGKNNAG